MNHGNNRSRSVQLDFSLGGCAIWQTPEGERRVDYGRESPSITLECFKNRGPYNNIFRHPRETPGPLTGQRVTVKTQDAFWVDNAEYPHESRPGEWELVETPLAEGWGGTIGNQIETGIAPGYQIAWDDDEDGSFLGWSIATEEEIRKDCEIA